MHALTNFQNCSMGNTVTVPSSSWIQNREKAFQNASFELLPTKIDEDNVVSFRRKEEPSSVDYRTHLVSSRQSKVFHMTVTALVILIVLFSLTTAIIGSIATSALMKNQFISREELKLLMEESHIYYTNMEELHNDTLRVLRNEISALQEQVDGIHTSLADLEGQRLESQIDLFTLQKHQCAVDDLNSKLNSIQRNVSEIRLLINTLTKCSAWRYLCIICSSDYICYSHKHYN